MSRTNSARASLPQRRNLTLAPVRSPHDSPDSTPWPVASPGPFLMQSRLVYVVCQWAVYHCSIALPVPVYRDTCRQHPVIVRGTVVRLDALFTSRVLCSRELLRAEVFHVLNSFSCTLCSLHLLLHTVVFLTAGFRCLGSLEFGHLFFSIHALCNRMSDSGDRAFGNRNVTISSSVP